MTRITTASQLIVGRKYCFAEPVQAGTFRSTVDTTKPFTVRKVNMLGLTEIRFEGTSFDQYFTSDRIIRGEFIVIPYKATVPATQLSRQCRILLRDLTKGQVTQRTALMDHGVMALPRRIADLKEAGYPVEKVMKINPHTGQRYASYYLAA